MVPGGVFNIDNSEPCPYVRAAFSLSTPQQIDEVQHANILKIIFDIYYNNAFTIEPNTSY